MNLDAAIQLLQAVRAWKERQAEAEEFKPQFSGLVLNQVISEEE